MKQSGKLILFLLCWAGASQAQEKLSLGKAYELAEKNYPEIKQRDLLKQTAGISIANLSKAYLPQLSLSGQASYQSDVTKLNIPLPGISMPSLSKDQYKMLADLNQLLYDGGAIHARQETARLNESVGQQQVTVDLYQLKDRISQVYLGILYLDAQLKQVKLVENDVQLGIKRVEAQVNNGVAFRSNLDVLKAEMLKDRQRETELGASRRGLLDVLGLFLHQPLSDSLLLETPLPAPDTAQLRLNRPELGLFDAQAKLADAQLKLVKAGVLPKASLFVQGGYGRPGLNFLNNDFSFFYIAGVRFNWSLGNFYTHKGDKQLVELNKNMVSVKKETFELNTQASLKQQEAEIRKWEQLVRSDGDIIRLRNSIKEAARAQLENGVITANDYLREVNAEDQARLTLITHQLQLLQAQINYQIISGNQ